jgi:hypothetical protein
LTQENISQSKQSTTPGAEPEIVQQNKHESVAESKQETGTDCILESAKSATTRQGSRPPPFQPTTSTVNFDGVEIAWDIIEESCREIGVIATADKYRVSPITIRARKRDHKWKKIPDGRTLVKQGSKGSRELTSANGDLSAEIAPFRAKAFQKINDSLGKFKAKAPKSFRELDSCVKIGERMLGINEEKPAQQNILIKINEAVDNFDPDSLPHEIEATVIQGDSAPAITDEQETPHADHGR